ncbi:long-chain fatty acid--CoA ligase [Polyangium jinanense]|uniref:Long-chain fatty acid--CoA ligase n=1 Tax=Polyangium jinanense TaxID=2829994 RepID=A0A9X3X2M8_9BACT|nr:long-chain fatty acid--CoA ligase [Polyangium jinanense]MDC3958610.1 long-chain fatty acid--CoA ligase [Polyangium jinanense]MDC3983082.1 long-chain fatty acid--CoA ligase [Polyangium jinanense]
MLAGRMMDFPLTLTHFLERARTFFGRNEIVSRLPDKTLVRTTYADFYRRTSKLAGALARLGVRPGDRVATLSWNHQRHLEVYLGAPAMGAVVHTLNLRLHPNELGYIANHAEDKVVVVDRSLLPLWHKFADQVRSVRHVVVVPDCPAQGEATSAEIDYEELIAPEKDEYPWPTLDERSAAMICYTSGTTGNPKGVVYSHRSTVLHTLVVCNADTIGVREADTVLPVVPMFHAAAWGLPYAAVMAGSKLVFPGPHLDPPSLLDLIAAEKVTIAAGVPTIWLGILQLLDQHPGKWDLSAIRSTVIGGSAAPPALIDGFKSRHGIDVTHAWGMTETNPVGTLARVKHGLSQTDDATKLGCKASQGYAVPFVEQRHVGEDGQILPWDGETMGELEVRGPWVASSYFGGEGPDRFTEDGWFKTGDVVTIDREGYLRITDRSKDVIKSGGEWISSVALENALMSHPAVLEAAVFAARHPKWTERPLAAIVLKEGKTATKEELNAHIEAKFAKFWLPDDYVFMAQIPRTSTGKFLKTKLRELYGDHLEKQGSSA